MEKVTSLLILLYFGCTNSQNQSQSKNRRLEKSLHNKWQLNSISYSLAEVNKYDHNDYKIVECLDYNKTNNFYLEFKKTGDVMCNDSVLIATWSVDDINLEIKGKNYDGIPLDLNSLYGIERLNNYNLDIHKYYFDKKGNIKLNVLYRFTNMSKINSKPIEDSGL